MNKIVFTSNRLHAKVMSMVAEVETKKKSDKGDVKESTEVIAFRLRENQVTALDEMVAKNRVVGVHSSDQYARWVVEQYLAGRLILLQPMGLLAPGKAA